MNRPNVLKEQIQQAEKDMKDVNQKTKDVLNSLN